MEEKGKEQEGLATQEERVMPDQHQGSANVQDEEGNWEDAEEEAEEKRAEEHTAKKMRLTP
eukprot:11646462-Ditylum_brightwellii.AAC.1